MTTTKNNEHKELYFSSEREQSQVCLNSAEHEKNQGRKVLNVPILRFKEFQGEWEKMRLDAFTRRVMRKNKSNQSRLPLTISAQYGLVDQITFFNKVIASTDMSNYYLLKKGEFAYNKSYSSDYPWGAIKRLDNYEQGALSSLYICFTPQDNVESDFILQYFESPKWHKGVSEIAVEGARNHGLLNVSVQDFFHTYHYVPKDKKEQIKIAKLLMLLDERITTQNKIIDKLQSLIKGIVDCTILRKEKNAIVGDVCSISEQIRAEANIDDIITVRLHGNGVCKSSAENLQLGATQYYRRRAGQLIYGKQNFHNGAIGIVPISLDNGITSKDIPSFDIDEMKCNSVYLLAQLQSPQYYKPAEALTTGTGSKRLKEETFLKMPIVLPNKREQDNIAVLFHRASMNLDHAKRLLELLSIQKQFLLRQMFI